MAEKVQAELAERMARALNELTQVVNNLQVQVRVLRQGGSGELPGWPPERDDPEETARLIPIVLPGDVWRTSGDTTEREVLEVQEDGTVIYAESINPQEHLGMSYGEFAHTCAQVLAEKGGA